MKHYLIKLTALMALFTAALAPAEAQGNAVDDTRGAIIEWCFAECVYLN